MNTRLVLFIGILLCQPCWGQKPEYDFYREFRNVIGPTFRETHPTASVAENV